MNDDSPPLRPCEFAWRFHKPNQADVLLVWFGPLHLTLALVAIIAVSLYSLVPWPFLASHPWLLAIPVAVPAMTVPMQHVRVDARGTRVRDWWGVIPRQRRQQALSCPIVAQYHRSTVDADATVRVEIGDIVLDVEQPRELAEWLEAQRRLIAQEAPRGPYR